MKPFDIEKAKQGHQVCTRDGKKVRILCYDMKVYPDLPILAIVENGDREIISAYHLNGEYSVEGMAGRGEDLMMASEKHEGWVNIYWLKNGRIAPGAFVWDSIDEAKKGTIGREKNLIATVKIKWEE